jgi:hypothetical protein
MWSNDLFSPMMTMTCLIGVAVSASLGRNGAAAAAVHTATAAIIARLDARANKELKRLIL